MIRDASDDWTPRHRLTSTTSLLDIIEIPPRLVGRDDEIRTLRALVTAARNRAGGALVVRGEPGIGKTSLLHAATARLPGVRVIRVDGYEAESAIAFAALHRLVVPLRAYEEALPAAQLAALRTATGSAEGPPPDRFLVGLGLLGLLDVAAGDQPIVCAVDDAHWLDPESLEVLAFVARRLQAESLAIILAARDDDAVGARTAGVPVLQLEGLDRNAALALLTASVPQTLDPLAAAAIVAATGGNPLALVDLSRDLDAAELAAIGLADDPVPIGRTLESHYVHQVRRSGEESQRWMLVAAAGSSADTEVVLRAARALGIPASAADGAEAAGLVVLGSTVRFRHPLVRSAAYTSASGAERRRVHAALSSAAAELGLTELEAVHAAKATLGTDPAVADRLEQAADRAGERGGFASRASVLTRAVELTPAGPDRVRRQVAAAEAALAAGAAHVAYELLAGIDRSALDPVLSGRVIAVETALAIFVPEGTRIVHASELMLRAAELFHGRDLEREQLALVRAFEYAMPPERLMEGVTLDELGRRLTAGSELSEGTVSTVLRGLGAHILLPYADAVPLMRRAVDALASIDDADALQLGTISVALTTALWDAPARHAHLVRCAAAARERGSLHVLDTVLWILSLVEVNGGSPRRSGEYVEHVRELRRAIGYDAENVVNVAYLAWQGAPREQVEAIAEGAGALGFGGVQASAASGLAARALAEGAYAEAYALLKPLVDDPYLQVTPLQYPDFVEAAVRSGRPADAAPFVALLAASADANGSPWNRGVSERSRALVAANDDAEVHYRAAISALDGAGVDLEIARAHLLYGEWLRRSRRRREAREHLATAAEAFEQMDASAFAARARAELDAAGGSVRTSAPGQAVHLTAQESTVARLAASGRTNAEIGATLFISPNTVDYHLRKVFQKLAITSRRQLADRLDALRYGQSIASSPAHSRRSVSADSGLPAR
ncbi:MULTISPECIES: AAA family ATPase [Mumia]|uniref:AAA family ATPase n=1 Tax=Mumia TaxID=1546255 RepID=UPI001969D271|nr:MULTISPECIES: LuxR family transcriptional regulator [Mumia]